MIFISQPRSVANDNHWVALGVTEQRAPLRRASAASTASVASGDGVEASVGRLNMLNHVFNSPDAEISSSRQRARSKYSPIRGQEPDVRLVSIWIGHLSEADIADVDRDHQHVRDRPAVRAACIGAPFGRQMNSVRHDIIRSELRSVETAGNVDVIIVTPQSEIMIKEKILN